MSPDGAIRNALFNVDEIWIEFGMNLTQSDYDFILQQFPPIDFAFTYGSGIFEQSGYDYAQFSKKPAALTTDAPMVDFVFAVQNPAEWHRLNVKMNRSHYTPLFPVDFVADYIQMTENSGIAMWFNVMIPMNLPQHPHRQMKYGVISVAKLLMDLKEWSYLYVAGRLHKPVCIINRHAEIEQALDLNRKHAFRTALLLLPEQFTEKELYMTIAGLSYMGDPRMSYFENPNKVKNLVTPVLSKFRDIYTHHMDLLLPSLMSKQSQQITSTIIHQDVSSYARDQLYHKLPSALYLEYRKRAAGAQSFRGALSSGFAKGAKYLLAKALKGLRKR